MQMKSIRWCAAILVFLALQGFADTSEWPWVEGAVQVRLPVEVKADWAAVRPPGDRIRMASYNIQDFTDAINDGPARTPERMIRQAELVSEILEGFDPDIVVMQEIENEQALATLNETLSDPYPLAYITKFSGGSGRELNIAVLSRAPLSGVRELDFGRMRGPGRPPRGVLSFILNLDERHKLLVYGVHLKSNWGDRERNVAKRFSALRILAEDAQQVRQRYPLHEWEMLALGDVNVDPDAVGFADDCSLEPLDSWADLWRGRPLEERITLPTRYGDPLLEFPPATFDRFFASPELRASPWQVEDPFVSQRGVYTQDVFVVGGENDRHASDHYPVFVDLVR